MVCFRASLRRSSKGRCQGAARFKLLRRAVVKMNLCCFFAATVVQRVKARTKEVRRGRREKH